MAFRLAHIKRSANYKHQGGGEPLRGAHSILPAPATTINRLGTALDNLALAAANNTTVFQQLTSANLALTTSNAMLTAANKELSEALAKAPATTPVLEECAPVNPDAHIHPLTYASVNRTHQAKLVGSTSLVTILIAICRSLKL